MTITGQFTDNNLISGYLLYTAESLPSPNITASIYDVYNADLQSLSTPDVGPPLTWNVTWNINFYCTDILSSANRYISALPKYNLGQYNYTYKGQAVAEGFLNYTSQRLISAQNWIWPQNVSYPSPFTPAEFINASYFFFIHAISYQQQFPIPADTVYLQFPEVDPNTVQVYLFYFAYPYGFDQTNYIYLDF
jgi:hypothetical protein